MGIQSQIDYGQEVQRLAYMKSYQEVILIPNLHLNQMSLIDQRPYDSYQAVKAEGDAFHALYSDQHARRSYLETWDIMTGKKIEEFDCTSDVPEICNYVRFRSADSDLFQTGLYKRQLLVSKEPLQLSENIMTQYYNINMLKPKFEK